MMMVEATAPRAAGDPASLSVWRRARGAIAVRVRVPARDLDVTLELSEHAARALATMLNQFARPLSDVGSEL